MNIEEIKEAVKGFNFNHHFDGYSDIWEAEQGDRTARITANKDEQSLGLYSGDLGHSKPLNKWSIIKAQNWLRTGIYTIPEHEYRSALRGIHQISSSAWSDNYQDAFDQINEICGDILETEKI